jgi:N-acetyltransferase 10
VELGLPSNQVLAMFNKAVRKISIALNSVVEAREKKSLLSDDKRKKAEAAVERMRDVTRQTLDEDARVAAKEAATLLQPNLTNALPQEVRDDPELMQYVVKGTAEQWEKVLEGKESVGATPVQIESIREKRRSLNDIDIEREVSRVGVKKQKSDHKKSSKGRRSR